MSQHASLTPERWARFTLDQQIPMIANEMKRASALTAAADQGSRQKGYERVLRLLDLTVATQTKPTLRRWFLRWRDLVAALHAAADADARAHDAALGCLLRFTPEASRQLAFV